MTRMVVGLAAAALALAACGGSTVRSGQRLGRRVRARELYPLARGNAWSYDMDIGDGSVHLRVYRVIRVSGNQVWMDNGGPVPLRYELRDRGIYRPSADVWLLRDPIRVGESWRSALEATAEVTAVDQTVETAAGRFERCVVIRETGGDLGRTVAMTYCPGVGPVVLDVRMRASRRTAVARARLRGFLVH